MDRQHRRLSIASFKPSLEFCSVALLGCLALASLSALRAGAALQQIRNWGLENPTTDSHIHISDAWRKESGSSSVVVAVIDTGIDPEHPDLKANLWHDPKTKEYGWDFTKDKANPQDDHGHGTHVAGIIGATMNARAGISGVSPKASLMVVKYYSEKASGQENLKNSVRALQYAIEHGAHIINYSGGGAEFSMEEYTALKKARDKGILVVAAAGNEHSNGDDPDHYYYPCAYRLENLVCVSATDIHNRLLPSSNWGKKAVDIAAPGEGILSTAPQKKYVYMTGTSQATAFVTGVAHLLLSHNRNLTPVQLKEIIRKSADPIASLSDKVTSGGKLNAERALKLLDYMTDPGVPVAQASVGGTRSQNPRLEKTEGWKPVSPRSPAKMSNL